MLLLPSTLLSLILLHTTTSLAQGSNPSTVTVFLSRPSSLPDPSYKDTAQFIRTILNSTNTFRAQHNSSALVWNDTLAPTGQNWSNQCLWEHSGGPTGENLARGYPNTTAAVDAWGFERKDYNYKKPKFSELTGHFTQLVWKQTTSVGCGRTDCMGRNMVDGWLLACEYWPPGNIDGTQNYVANVQAPAGEGVGLGDSGGVGMLAGGRSSVWWAVGVTIAAVVIAGGMS